MTTGKRFIAISAAVAATSILAGCAGTRGQGLRSHFVEFDDQQRSEYAAAQPGEYRIQEGDQLVVVFPFIEELKERKTVVLSDGSVTLPGIDRVVLAGLTLTAADSLVTAMYGKSYRDPVLSLLVDESVGRRVYVLGEVAHPGLYPVPYGGIGILSAIAAAGGFTEDARKSNTVLVRLEQDGYLCQEIDLSRFHTVEGVVNTGVPLETYDVIYVPRSKIGDFAYFSDKVLDGILNITQIVSDVRYIESGSYRK
jgi:protein involved in polysaccharide export with SLBB domain